MVPNVPSTDTEPVCQTACLILAFLKVFGGMLSFIWTFNISYILKTTLYDNTFSMRKWWSFIRNASVLVALIFALMY